MPIKVVVLSDFIPEAILLAASPELLQAVTADIMSAARAFWIKRAQEKLTSSRADYINGIQEVVLGDGSASVTLSGAMATMVEEGMGPYDMHDTLLGPNVPIASPGHSGKRVNKDGLYYRSIPFRHQVPGTLGQGGGAAMGSAYDPVMDGAALGKKVYSFAKKLSPSVGMPGGGTQWGGRLPAGLAPLLKPHHTTDIYAGMVKSQKMYGEAKQNQYVTFRTISQSQPHKWMHPGIGAANISEEVTQFVEQIAPSAFQAALENAL